MPAVITYLGLWNYRGGSGGSGHGSSVVAGSDRAPALQRQTHRSQILVVADQIAVMLRETVHLEKVKKTHISLPPPHASEVPWAWRSKNPLYNANYLLNENRKPGRSISHLNTRISALVPQVMWSQCIFLSLNPTPHASYKFWGGSVTLWRWGEWARGDAILSLNNKGSWATHNWELRVYYIQRAERIIPSRVFATTQFNPAHRQSNTLRGGEDTRVIYFVNGRTSTKTTNSQSNTKHKKVNVFHIYISSGNSDTTFKTKEKARHPKVIGISHRNESSTQMGGGGFRSQTSTCRRKHALQNPFTSSRRAC